MKKLSLIVLLLGLIFIFPAFAQNLKSTISSIGCKQIAATETKPSVQTAAEHQQWLSDKFGVISKTSFLAKCSVKGTFYSFLFEEEIFENGPMAVNRIKNLQKLPAGEHDKSDYAVPKILAEGFIRGKRLYTVGAFAVFLEGNGSIKKYRDKLAEKVK
jgi:hypothetical protein